MQGCSCPAATRGGSAEEPKTRPTLPATCQQQLSKDPLFHVGPGWILSWHSSARTSSGHTGSLGSTAPVGRAGTQGDLRSSTAGLPKGLSTDGLQGSSAFSQVHLARQLCPRGRTTPGHFTTLTLGYFCLSPAVPASTTHPVGLSEQPAGSLTDPHNRFGWKRPLRALNYGNTPEGSSSLSISELLRGSPDSALRMNLFLPSLANGRGRERSKESAHSLPRAGSKAQVLRHQDCALTTTQHRPSTEMGAKTTSEETRWALTSLCCAQHPAEPPSAPVALQPPSPELLPSPLRSSSRGAGGSRMPGRLCPGLGQHSLSPPRFLPTFLAFPAKAPRPLGLLELLDFLPGITRTR